MPDINSLLRWAVENSTATANDGAAADQQLSLRFRPNQSTPAQAATLHASDPSMGGEISPASTPGPVTPVQGSSELPTLPAARSDLTSEMLDLIMGKPDSMVMKEKMAIATDESKDVDERVEALDDFEMLIELIDNANNIAVLKLWQPLLALLQSPEQEIVRHACWIIGTAVQNNLKAQSALYIFDALPAILSLIHPTSGTPPPAATRAKAVYALSSALKHWPLASSALSASTSRGYDALRHGVTDADAVVRRKVAFLIGTLLMQAGQTYEGEMPGEVRTLVEEHTGAVDEGLAAGLQRTGVLGALVDQIGASEGDVEFDENAVRALARAGEAGVLSAEEKRRVVDVWNRWGASGQAERGLEGEDAAEIAAALA